MRKRGGKHTDEPAAPKHVGLLGIIASLGETEAEIAALAADRTRHEEEVLTPERALLGAVLTQAIRDVVEPKLNWTRNRRRLISIWLEAKRWVESDDQSWPCSFVPICHELGYEPEWLRGLILEMANKAQPEEICNIDDDELAEDQQSFRDAAWYGGLKKLA